MRLWTELTVAKIYYHTLNLSKWKILCISFFMNFQNKYLTKTFWNNADYYLGCVPTEEEINEFTDIVKNQNEPNTVDINDFVPHMEKQIRAFK